MPHDDTIVAVATATGDAALAVTRLSGPDALAIAASCFRGKRSPLITPSHRILFGEFVAAGSGGADGGVGGEGAAGAAALDTVLLSIFRAPHSYTGEDVVEISSHGGPAVPRAILESLIAAGARPARPGEFTERAYRNGKLDLAQAEAVASVVRARSDRALRAAGATLGGELSRRVAALDTELVTLLAEVESRLDFPGDVREAADVGALAARCDAMAGDVREWLDRLPSARRREQGWGVAIVGAPNVGKSSLLNALVGFDRAIVSEEPGTTRDTVEASIWLDGVELRLTDTAGVREAADRVERLGVERAERAAGGADLAIVVLDCTRPGAGASESARLTEGIPTIVAWNKSDLGDGGDAAAMAAAEPGLPGSLEHAAAVKTVAVRAGGVDSLIAAMRLVVAGAPCAPGAAGATATDDHPTTSARQEALLRDALGALERAGALLRGAAIPAAVAAPAAALVSPAASPAAGPGLSPEEIPYDLAAVDLTAARRALGEMIGRGVDDAVVAAIFQRFCIGK
ncbi:MAG TPA: tRNA uridine-5-carboxymethylaminomethyl(34) synthesis GTPase MnmE [Candidatus Eisenbacteria bacterium]|nr:tRNA uridine-5-carboxymethylaminomethyl(34) synthesis GTPase MnmE [Candidatus Eisenbacteria bacterium]